jgi:hypothetical protein
VRLGTGPITVDWSTADALPIDAGALEARSHEGARYLPLPAGLGDAKQLETWKQAFARWLRQSKPLRIQYSTTLKRSSNADESERDFRIRLQDSASAQRDIAVEKLRWRSGCAVRRASSRASASRRTDRSWRPPCPSAPRCWAHC